MLGTVHGGLPRVPLEHSSVYTKLRREAGHPFTRGQAGSRPSSFRRRRGRWFTLLRRRPKTIAELERSYDRPRLSTEQDPCRAGSGPATRSTAACARPQVRGGLASTGSGHPFLCLRRSTRWALPRPLLRTHLPLVRPVAVTPLAIVLVSSTRRRRRPARRPAGEALADPIPVPWHAEEPKASQADRPVAPEGGHHRAGLRL